MSTSSGDGLTPEKLKEQVLNAELSFLPEKSREKYLHSYELFNNWRLSQGAKTYSETVLLSYFLELSKTRLPSTLWSIYSMLKAVLKTKRDVNIETYPKLVAFLKKKSEGHKPKKSKIFTAPEIEKFLNEAPDRNYLDIKVGLIIGIYGACRCNELLNLTVNDIEKHSDKLMLVKLFNANTKIDRSFVIREEYVNIIDKYMSIRPAHTKTTRFFLQYYNGKCKVRPMGINKISEIPRKIATFLKLQEPHLYTGHCLRRTSATLLANLTVLKRHGGWKSSTVAEGYIEDSIESKSKICKSTIDMSRPSTSIESRPVSPAPANPPQYTNIETGPLPNTQVNNTTITVPNKTITFNLTNCSNFTFNF